MHLSPGGWLSWDIGEVTDGGENGKNGRDKQWHTTTRVIRRKTYIPTETWSAYATPSRGDTSLVVDNESGHPIAGWAGWLAALSPWLSCMVISLHGLVLIHYT